MLFYSAPAPVPAELRTPELLLRPLRTSDVDLDYAALMDSKEMLRRWSQSDWPADDFTLADNFKDLAFHEREHVERVAFTYTVLDPAASECLGCVYIKPMGSLFGQDDGAASPEVETRARVAFWAREPTLADDLDKRLLDTLTAWFEREWEFSRVVFFTSDLDKRQLQIFTDAGLKRIHEVERVDNQSGELKRWVVWS